MIYGLDIGGTKIEIAIFNKNLELIESKRISTPTSCYLTFIDALVELVTQADEKYGKKGSVGMGIPGLINKNGQSLSSNIPCINNKNVASDFKARINRNIVIENDCRCFVLSEAVIGAGKGYKNVFGAIIGTGASGGFSIQGKLYKSRQGISGEYGHIPLPAFLQQKYQLPVEQCGCSLPSCFESYVSGPGILYLNKHFGGNSSDVPSLVKLWASGDAIAKTTFECYLDLLGACFANIVISFDPDVIVVGGGISLIDLVIENLPKAIEEHLFINFSSPPIIRAKFGDSSGVYGAAILASQQNHE